MSFKSHTSSVLSQWLTRFCGDWTWHKLYTGQLLEPFDPLPPPQESLQGFHLCVAVVWASICLIRGCGTNVNKCCQMWKDHCPHMVPFSGWMKPESPRGFWFWQTHAEVGFSNGYGTEPAKSTNGSDTQCGCCSGVVVLLFFGVK